MLETKGSVLAWQTVKPLGTGLQIASLQILLTENRLQREIASETATTAERGVAASALQRFRWYLEEQVIWAPSLDVDIAVSLARSWQRGQESPPAMLLLWAALAVTSGASHFLSFDPRTRRLAENAGLKVLPARI